MDDAVLWSRLTTALWVMQRSRKQARMRLPSELLPSSFRKEAGQRTLTGTPSELCQSLSPGEARHTLKRALQGMVAEILQCSLSLQTESRRLQMIQNPISRLNTEILRRQIRFIVPEADWTQQGNEVSK